MSNRRRGHYASRRGHYDHRRRSHYGRGYDRHHNDHSHARRVLTTLAIWIIVLVAIGNGAITFTGK